MKESLFIIISIATIPAIANGKEQEMVRIPNTYSECIQKASDINDKLIEYRADVNKFRDKFGIAGEY